MKGRGESSFPFVIAASGEKPIIKKPLKDLTMMRSMVYYICGQERMKKGIEDEWISNDSG
jgi:hypothetical protein